MGSQEQSGSTTGMSSGLVGPWDGESPRGSAEKQTFHTAGQRNPPTRKDGREAGEGGRSCEGLGHARLSEVAWSAQTRRSFGVF
eukprot:scaffold1220_cov259-Pinguiococcus_pyrenoidosus.AAC.79